MAYDLKEDAAITMCLMQMTFLPSFFVIMSHLSLHLVKKLVSLGLMHVH